MDLHFTEATPTAEEIAAVDGVAIVASGSKRTYLLPGAACHPASRRLDQSGCVELRQPETGRPSG